MLRCDSLPRLQLEWRRTLILCNRGRADAPFGRNACRVCGWSAAEGRFRAIAAGESPLLAGVLAAFAAGVPQNADFVQSRLENAPFGRNACRVCSWSAADGRFHAIAAGKMPFGPECLPRLQLECRRWPISCNRDREDAPLGRNACCVCSWSAAEGRFCAIAARRTPRRDCSRCMLRCDSLPRLQLECRRWPILCNRGRRNEPFGRNACRVCSWSAADGQFRAIAAGKMPLLAGMLAAFAAGVAQVAVFMQSRPEKRPLRSECLPRLQLECRRWPFSCNRGQRNAPFGRNACREHPFRLEHLPRLQLEWRRRAISCNRGREDAPFGRNVCRVCIWSAAEGQFHAIAAGRTPLMAGMRAAFATGVAQKADFVQSRPAKRSFRPAKRPPSASETPPFGQRNAPSACKNYPRG